MEQAVEVVVPAKYHHGNLRATLLEVARRLLEEQGVEAVGLREVARGSGVSANAPYRHFADKEALLAAVAAQGFRELLAALTAAGGGDRTEEDRYRAGCRAYMDFVTNHSAMARLMFDTFSGKFGLYPELKEAGDECLQQFLRLVSNRHGLAPDSEAAFTYAVSVWSILHGFAMLKSAGALDFPRQDLLPTPEQLAVMVVPLAEGGGTVRPS